MIRGRLTDDHQPLVTLGLVGDNGIIQPVTFLVDTGYDGWLVLPSDIVGALALVPTGDANIVTVAGGATLEWPNYRVKLHWDGRIREVDVLESNTRPILGMAMLDDPAAGHADILTVNPADRTVLIQRQPPPAPAGN